MIVTLLLMTLLAGALVYSGLAVVAAFRYLGVRTSALAHVEPVSILKPLAGLDLGLESNLRAFFEQDYPSFEILFAAREESDPGIAVARRLMGEYPHVPSKVVITGEPPYANAKVYSLDKMMAAASHELLVMSDSDIRVTSSMLKTVAAEFQDSKLGVATCPYRAVAGASFWSRLEATGMNTDFWSGVLVARMLEGMRFGVGPTIVARRSVIQGIGGFDRIKDYLAEDFVLGKFAVEAGHGVSLSSYVIEHHIGSTDFAHNAAHRLRWARSTRRSRSAGYVGQVFTMPFAIAVLIALWDPRLWFVLPITFAVRALAARVVSFWVLGAKLNWFLLPLEDLAVFGFWVAGFFGNTIVWRGRTYRLERDGRFTLIGQASR